MRYRIVKGQQLATNLFAICCRVSLHNLYTNSLVYVVTGERETSERERERGERESQDTAKWTVWWKLKLV